MKKLLILAIFMLVCADGLGLASQTDAKEIKRRTSILREQLKKLEDLRNKFNATQKRIDEISYITQSRGTLKQFKDDLDQLKQEISLYLDNLAGEQREQVELQLREEEKQLDNALNEISKKFSAEQPKVTAGIDKFVKPVSDTLNNIDQSLLSANPRIGAGGQSSLPPITTSSGQVQGQNQGEDSGFAYGPYLLALLLLIAGANVTWWLNNRLVGLERALNKQNQAVQQLSQQLDEALDVMWQDVVKLQQQGAANHQQDFANLTAEIERLRATMQTARSQPSSAEPKMVRRRGEEQADYAPRSVATAAPRLVSAMDYLRHAGGNGIRAKTAMLRPDVLQSSEDDGPYLLLPAEGQADVYNVIPAVPRFQSSQDYSHFSNFYDCDQPSSGEVFILQPARAVYDHATGQWKLRSKGRLQIS